MEIDELTSVPALEAIVPEWEDLWTRCPGASPFQTPQWLLPWSKLLFAGGELCILTGRVAGSLVALAPLFRYGLEHKTVAFLGSGVSDYLDFLLDARIAPHGASDLLNHLLNGGPEWSTLDLQELPPESPLYERADALDCSVCPVIDLPDSWDELRARLEPKFRTDLQRARNRLQRAGGVRITRADQATLDEAVAVLFALHAERWTERSGPGMLATEVLQQFHREVMTGFLQAGMLRLYVLYIEDEPAGAIYAFAAHGRTCAYLGGFAPKFARFSPGSVLMGHVIEEALREGSREFDFLRGQESYKRLWGTRDRTTRRILIHR